MPGLGSLLLLLPGCDFQVLRRFRVAYIVNGQDTEQVARFTFEPLYSQRSASRDRFGYPQPAVPVVS